MQQQSLQLSVLMIFLDPKESKRLIIFTKLLGGKAEGTNC